MMKTHIKQMVKQARKHYVFTTYQKPQERYPKLVRIFYPNLSYKDGIINSKVKKHPITLSLEKFACICNLSFLEQDYDQIDLEGNEFNYDIPAHTLLIDPSSRIPSTFIVDLIHPNSRLIHHTINHVLFPRKINYITMQKSNSHAIWFSENQIEKNQANDVLYHMLDSKKRNITLPYAKLITIFFEIRWI